MLFESDDPDVAEKFYTLWYSLDGTQKCAEEPDKYTGNWANRDIPEDVAERQCAGCPFYKECRDYAVTAQEEYGIWGGTTPDMRKRLNNGTD